MKIRILVFVIACLSTLTFVSGQDIKTNYVDAVYLKDGSVLVGKLLTYEVSKVIEFQLESGSKVILDYKDVKKVIQYLDPLTYQNKVKRGPLTYDYQFKEHGLNHQFLFSTLWGRGEWNTLKVGIAAEYVLGYRFNRAFGLGIGTGVNNYDLRSGETILPFYIEQRGYISDHWIAPTYSIAGGYGVALKNGNTGFEKVNGGLLLNATAGLRIGAAKGINLLTEIGLRYQRATYTDSWDWEPTSFSEYRWDYLRWNLRIGLTF